MRQAIALKRWLVEQDPPLANEIFLDVDPDSGLQTGTRWKDALRQANARCEAVVCLLSANWEASHECKVEYRTAENLNKQIFVARLEPSTGDDLTSEWQRCDLFGVEDTTAIDIGAGPPVEFATAGLYRLRDGIQGAGIGADSFVWPPPNDPGRAPYRGWEPLEEPDAAVFFGRDAQIVRALDALRGMRMSAVNALFVVLGPSGTGKSSFLRAGVLPRLRREDRRFVLLDLVRPERNVLTGQTGLAAAISATRLRFGMGNPSLGEIKTACAAGDIDLLTGWLQEIREVAAGQLVLRGGDGEVASEPTLVLPLDQAEELFSADAGEQSDGFLRVMAALAERLNITEAGLVVAATIRTDRYEVMQTHPLLAGVGSVLFDELKPMPATQFKEVITGPAHRATEGGRPLTVAPDLVEQLLSDAGAGADTMPMLALTMARLYTDYGSTAELTLAHYEALGGMRHVVQTEIDEVLSTEPGRRSAELAALRSAFIPWLATINPDNDQPMRRVARWSDLPAASRPLIDALVSKRLMVKDTRDGQTVVEVALESLLRQWDSLAGWLRDERKDLKDADDLERSAAAWAANGRDPAWLLEGSRLAEAIVLVNKPGFSNRLSSVHDYLTASHLRETERREAEEQQRQAELQAAQERAQHAQERQATAEAHTATMRKRSRVLRAVLAVTAIVAVAAVFGFVRADSAGKEAQQRFEQATSVRLTAEGLAMMTGNRPGGDIQAIQEILAARALTSAPDDEALYSVVTKDINTRKIIPAPSVVWTVAFSPDGSRIAAGGRDGFARVWNTETGELVGELTGHTSTVIDLAFSPDGRLLATGSDDQSVQIWDPETGTQIRQLDGHSDSVYEVAFSPDGRRLATTGADRTLRIWNPDTGELEVMADTGHQDIVTGLAFSSDGQRLITCSDDETVQLWAADTAVPEADPVNLGDGNINAVAFSPDGTRFATGGDDVNIWDARTMRLVGAAGDAHANSVASVAFSPDGRQLASASADATVQVWDAYTGIPVGWPITGHEGTVFSVAFSPDGKWLASGSRDGTVRIWNPTAGQPLVGHSDKVRAVAYSPDGDSLVSASADGTVRMWNPGTGEPLGQPLDAGTTLEAVAFSADGALLAAGGAEGQVVIWDTRTRKVVTRFHLAGAPFVRSLTFDSDGSRISVVDWDGNMGVWEVETGERVAEAVENTEALAMTADWQKLAISQSDGNGAIQLVDMTDGAKDVGRLTGHSTVVRSLAFSDDGTLLASGSDDNTARLWDVAAGTEIGGPLVGHTDTVYDVAFSPDKSRVITGSGDSTVRLWDVQTGKQIGDPLVGHRDLVISVAFRPDGESFASGGNDGTVRLWPATASPADLCAKLTANMSEKHWAQWVSPDIDYVKSCPDLPVAADAES